MQELGFFGYVSDFFRTFSRDQSFPAIAREIGLDRKQIARVLAQEGFKNTPSTPASKRLAEILKLRHHGISVAEINRRLGLSRNAIRKALTKGEDCQRN